MIQFEPIFKAFENANRTEENLPILFNKIAEYFLLKGYFFVNETKRVYICDVEFYYHEEKEGGIKDWIMYHRDNHPNCKDNKPVAYFKLGQFNAHS
ncbi:MAG: hypothetical protein SNI49_09670 [Rikenellaceae bacterium]